MSVYHFLLSLVVILIYLYISSNDSEIKKYRIYSIITILALIFLTPILSQETIDGLVNYYHSSTMQLKIIYLAFAFGVLYFTKKRSESIYQNVVTPAILIILVSFAPGLSNVLNNNVIDTLYSVFTNLANGDITVTHIMLFWGILTLFWAWNWRSEYLSPFAWFAITLAISNSELSRNIILKLA